MKLATLILVLTVAPAVPAAASGASWTAPVELPAVYEPGGPPVAVDRDGRGAVAVYAPSGALAVHEVDADGRLGPRVVVPGSEGAQGPVLALSGGVVTLAWIAPVEEPPPTRGAAGCCEQARGASWPLGQAPPAAQPWSAGGGDARGLTAEPGGAVAWTVDPATGGRGRPLLQVHRAGRTATVRARSGDDVLRLLDLDPAPGGRAIVTYARWSGRRSTLEQALTAGPGRLRSPVVLRRRREFAFEGTQVGAGPTGAMAALLPGRGGSTLLARGRVGGALGRSQRLTRPVRIPVAAEGTIEVSGGGSVLAAVPDRTGPFHLLARGRTLRRLRVRGAEPADGAALTAFTGSDDALLVFTASRRGLPDRVEAASVDGSGRVAPEAILGDERASGRGCFVLRLAAAGGEAALAAWVCFRGRGPLPDGEPTLHLARRR